MGLILGMLLAAAVDFGRAYYTALIVENMAGEGAAYGAKWPENDIFSQGCLGLVEANKNIQDRARRVAADRGLVISQPSQADVAVTPASCFDRCPGVTLKVTVTYRMNDLFLPSLLGMQSITIKKSATQRVERPAHSSCTATP
jgi:hypothetical protein